MTGHRVSGWIVPLLAVLVASFSAPAVAAEWEPLRLWGGAVQVAAARGDSSIVYAASQTSGLYRSADGGATWQLVSRGPRGRILRILGVDPHDPRRLYVLAYSPLSSLGELFRSDDGGLHWRKSHAGLRDLVFGLAFDPKTPGRLYAAAGTGLFRSDDRGATWARLAFPGKTVLRVAVAPADPRVVLASVQAGSDNSTWRSADGGATFSQVLDRLVHEYAFDPAHRGRLYGFDAFNLLRSDDLGATWTSLPRPPVAFEALTVTPAGTLLAGSLSLGVVRSLDGGLTWRGLGREGQAMPVDLLSSLVARKDGVVLAGGTRGVWKSLEDGRGWRAASAGILGHSILSLEVGADSTLWTSVGNGFFTSEDEGESFQSRGSGLGYVGFLPHLAIHPRQPQVAYAYGCCSTDPAGGSGLLKTEDGGRTWELLPYPGVQRDVAVVAVDPVDPDFVYAGGFAEPHGSRCTAARSTDGGTTWHCMGFFDFTDLAIDPRDPRILYAQLNDVLHRSTDRGQTWKKVSAQARALKKLTLDPTKPGRFFALSQIGPGIWRSDDGGRTWTLFAAGLPERAFANDLLLDPSRPDRIWMAVEVFEVIGRVAQSSTRIFRSDDAGTHWTEVSDGLTPGIVVLHLAADPERADILYAGTAGQGVYRLVVEE